MWLVFSHKGQRLFDQRPDDLWAEMYVTVFLCFLYWMTSISVLFCSCCTYKEASASLNTTNNLNSKVHKQKGDLVYYCLLATPPSTVSLNQVCITYLVLFSPQQCLHCAHMCYRCQLVNIDKVNRRLVLIEAFIFSRSHILRPPLPLAHLSPHHTVTCFITLILSTVLILSAGPSVVFLTPASRTPEPPPHSNMFS